MKIIIKIISFSVFGIVSGALRPGYQPHTGVFSSVGAAASSTAPRTPHNKGSTQQERVVSEFHGLLQRLKSIRPDELFDEHILWDAFRRINAMQSNTPQKRRHQAIVDLYYTITGRPSPSKEPLTELQQHEVAAHRLLSPETRKVARQLRFFDEAPKGSPVRKPIIAPGERVIEDVKHLFSGDERGGCHHRTGQDFKDAVIDVSTRELIPLIFNTESGVVSGKCSIRGVSKYSTLFPPRAAQEDIFRLVQSFNDSPCVATHERGKLFYHAGSKIFAIQFPYEENILNSSTYPVLSVTRVDAPAAQYVLLRAQIINARDLGWKQENHIQVLTVTTEQVIRLIQNIAAAHGHDLAKFLWKPCGAPDSIIIDIAPALKRDAYAMKLPFESLQRHVGSGLFVQVPLGLIDQVLGDGGALSSTLKRALMTI